MIEKAGVLWIRDSARVLIIPIAFALAGCAHGPRFTTRHDGETGSLIFEVKANKLAGSVYYGDKGAINALWLNAAVTREISGIDVIGLIAMYHGQGSIFDGEDRRLVLRLDSEELILQPFHVLDSVEVIKKDKATDEVVARSGLFHECALYEVTREELISLTHATSITVERLGSKASPGWWFGEKNFEVFSALVAEAYPGAATP